MTIMALPNSPIYPVSTESCASHEVEFRKLDTRSQQIRIIELSAKTARQILKRPSVNCYTHVIGPPHESAKALPYAALSYAWGNPARTHAIYLDDKLAMISANLFIALQHLEEENSALILWVDAICIDQDNETEKSHQVKLMAKIFRNAGRVLVWLGKSQDSSDDALDTLSRMGHEAQQLLAEHQHRGGRASLIDWTQPGIKGVLDVMRTRWFSGSINHSGFTAIERLFLRPWFRRVWVLQEAALNTNVTFVCGTKAVHKDSLCLGVSILLVLAIELCTSNPSVARDTPLWGTLSGANFIFRRTMHLVASDKKEFRLETLLLDTATNLGEWAYESTDPRDRIFALLGLSSDSGALGVSADYSRECKTVYLEVAEKLLSQSRTLDIMYAVIGQKRVKGMPSWVPDWSTSKPATFGLRPLRRFSASGPLSPSSPEFTTDEFGNRLLALSGCKFDTVKTVMPLQWDPRWCSNFYQETRADEFIQSLRSFGISNGTASDSVHDVTDALWKTPIADCDAFFHPSRGARPAASAAMKASFDAFIGIRKGDSKWREIASRPYIHVMNLISAQRRLFISSQGYYGLGDESLQTGDVICLLFGGDSPFLSRETDEGRYELVGEAYVHGIMHGEFLVTNPPIERFIFS